MSEPVVAQKAPITVEVEEGRSYFWCACGRSQSQPFCDGSHKGTDFVPLKYKAIESAKKYFCCCKKTGGTPFCDGTHNTL